MELTKCFIFFLSYLLFDFIGSPFLYESDPEIERTFCLRRKK